MARRTLWRGTTTDSSSNHTASEPGALTRWPDRESYAAGGCRLLPASEARLPGGVAADAADAARAEASSFRRLATPRSAVSSSSPSRVEHAGCRSTGIYWDLLGFAPPVGAHVARVGGQVVRVFGRCCRCDGDGRSDNDGDGSTRRNQQPRRNGPEPDDGGGTREIGQHRRSGGARQKAREGQTGGGSAPLTPEQSAG